LKNQRKVALALALALVTTAALAVAYGYFLCTYCSFQPPGTPKTSIDITDAVQFIRSGEGQAIPGSTGWKLGDTVSICDGTSCVPMVLGVSWMAQAPITTDGGSYRNAGTGSGGTYTGGGGGGSGGGGSLCCISGGEPTPVPDPGDPGDSNES
jgi:hypothetical protein